MGERKGPQLQVPPGSGREAVGDRDISASVLPCLPPRRERLRFTATNWSCSSAQPSSAQLSSAQLNSAQEEERQRRERGGGREGAHLHALKGLQARELAPSRRTLFCLHMGAGRGGARGWDRRSRDAKSHTRNPQLLVSRAPNPTLAPPALPLTQPILLLLPTTLPPPRTPLPPPSPPLPWRWFTSTDAPHSLFCRVLEPVVDGERDDAPRHCVQNRPRVPHPRYSDSPACHYGHCCCCA